MDRQGSGLRARGRPREGHGPAESAINRDILAVLTPGARGYRALLALCLALYLSGLAVFAYQTRMGLGVTGLQPPVFWGAYIVTFVFWVGIAHAGTLISAILLLFRSKWRNAVNRLAEAMTVIAVLTAGQLLAVHAGRIWKGYFMLPYPNQRGLWVNFKSPLVWDTFAISTYATISLLFLYVGMIPDLAVLRDRTTGWRHHLYGALCVGWQGTSAQWKGQRATSLLLAGLATPLVISVHSVVSFDFAMALVPGWHGTIFAPYFVAGAIFSGFALVITVMIPLRRIYGLEGQLTLDHLDNMAKFLLLTCWILLYSYLAEYFVAWYSAVEFEQTSFWLRLTGPFRIATAIMLVCNTLVPQLFWLRRFRRHLPTLFMASLLINLGMWFERYVIITTGLSREYVPSAWGLYLPSWLEVVILIASFGFFGFCLLAFLKLFPVIAIAEVKELEIHSRCEEAAELGGTNSQSDSSGSL